MLVRRLAVPSLAVVALTVGFLVTAVLIPWSASARSSIHVSISGQDHHPVVNKKWSYSVTVRSASGQKLSGTETTHYLYNGAVVGTEKPVNVRFKNGYYHDTIEFPPDAVGQPLRVWVVVNTKDGSGSAAWSITVVKR
ncbi:MAG: hypothetical protein ACLP4R_08705 [Solirubrobacteraceae bacterium]